MHRFRSFTSKLLALIVIATVHAAAPGATESSDLPVARLSVSASVLTWIPASSDNPISLTVSSDEIYLQQKFDAGKAPFLRREAPDGGLLPDGLYTWELLVIPSEAAHARDKETVTPIDKGSFMRRPPRRAQVQSGTFQVIGGAFVMRAEKSE
jgi:hypothetical protein